MNSTMQIIHDARRREHRERVARAMRRFDMDRCMLDLAHGLCHPTATAGALSVGYALEATAEADEPKGFRLDLLALPTAEIAERDAACGTYAKAYCECGGVSTPDGLLFARLSKRKKDGVGVSSVDGEKAFFDDPSDTASDFVGRLRAAVEPTVAAGEATFRIKIDSRRLAADVHRSLAIAEAGFDPAEPKHKATAGEAVAAPKM